MKASASNRSELAAFRRLLRDVANPAKLVLNPLAARISCASAEDLAASIKWALDVSLCRLAPRLRSIAVRYDVNREPQSSVCKDMGLSRRQFYRDHRAALTQLAALMLAPSGDAGTRSFTPAPAAIRGDRNVKTQRVASDSIVRSLSTGLRNLGQFTESIELLERDFHAHGGDTEGQLEATLEIAEIAIEAGRSSDVAIQLERLRGLTDGSILHRRADLAARHAIFLGHLEPSHGKRQESYRRAIALVDGVERAQPTDKATGDILLRALYGLSLSHDHQGEWIAARETARSAIATLADYDLTDSPMGVHVRANYCMRDARQFGNVDLACETLWDCLAIALRNGWIPAIGDIAVQFINLNLMRRQYRQALEWHQWIGVAGSHRLLARTRNFMAVDSAHAVTMLGHPDLALSFLNGSDDEGLAFAGARDYWRAEALRVGGDIHAALKLATQALDQAAIADSKKGQARCKRLLASCHDALGHTRIARKLIAECLELSEWFTSPYDYFLSVVAARELDRHYGNDESRLSHLLIGHGEAANFAAPTRSAQ